MTVQLLIDETPFGVRGAILQDEVPTRLLHNFHADGAPQTGELFWARVGKRKFTHVKKASNITAQPSWPPTVI